MSETSKWIMANIIAGPIGILIGIGAVAAGIAFTILGTQIVYKIAYGMWTGEWKKWCMP